LGGTQYVTLLGGEVTQYRNDLSEVIRHAGELGIPVHINTNLTDLSAVEDLLSVDGLGGLIVSVDGATESTHDAMRGRGTFAKTFANAKRIGTHPRIRSRQITLEIASVLTALNMHEAANLVSLAKELGAHRLNVKPVKLTGRARSFEKKLHMPHQELLEAIEQLVIAWLLDGTIELDLHLPPAAALYFNRKWGTAFDTTAHPACGGDGEFGYVDSYGNLLPCPAMSYEENMQSGLNSRHVDLNLLHSDVATAKKSSVFGDFESERVSRSKVALMSPCNACKFNDQCIPCTSDITLGRDDVHVDICEAVYRHGNESVPGIVADIFRLQPEGAGSQQHSQKTISIALEPMGRSADHSLLTVPAKGGVGYGNDISFRHKAR
jgi:MoaA/NifB/PqqE/SkfB family radical SAM enzyme